MALVNPGHGRQKFAAVAPLILVIGAALIWSGYATYHHAEGPHVPGQIAWTLIVALDGTVVVTTPIWLSTVLPPRARNYAALICMSALGGSMLINYAETGWPGVFPPLIAGALIHLVGVVLRAFARLDREASDDSESVDTPDAGWEHPMPSTGSLPDAGSPEPPSPGVDEPVDKSEDEPVDLRKAPPPPSTDTPYEIVSRMLIKAYATDAPEPTGGELTEAVRDAGHRVNDNYGRSAKARWKKNREQVIA